MSLPHLKLIQNYYGRESADVDFLCTKLENAKIVANFILVIMIKPGNYFNEHV